MKLKKHTSILAASLLFAAASCATAQTAFEKAVTPKPGEGPNISYTVNFTQEIGGPPPKRVITIPNVGEFRVLKGDFHTHTLFSDGRVWPAERVREAGDNGFDALAITDHIEYRIVLGGPKRNGKFGPNILLRDENDNYNFPYALAKAEAAKRKILLVPGAEITRNTMPPGHFLALFIKDANKLAAKQNDYREMFKETVAQGGFLIWAHPGWERPKGGGGSMKTGEPTTFTETHEEIYKNGWMHGIEAFNQRQFYPVVPSWCAEKDLGVFAGSDIHHTEFNMYGSRNPKRPVTLVFAKKKTMESLKEAFFAKRTVGWAVDMIFGQEKWVRPLFDACVEIKKENDYLTFVNKSSIPVRIKVNAETVQLDPLSTARSATTTNIITVENWLVGKYKPLTVKLD